MNVLADRSSNAASRRCGIDRNQVEAATIRGHVSTDIAKQGAVVVFSASGELGVAAVRGERRRFGGAGPAHVPTAVRLLDRVSSGDSPPLRPCWAQQFTAQEVGIGHATAGKATRQQQVDMGLDH